VQLEGILGRPPGAALLSEVYQRGGGVPLLTEALVNSDGTVSTQLPVSLRDLLLTAVAVLPERTQQTLRIAAAGGARLSHLLLATVTGLDDAALTAALRPAVDTNVLVSDSDGYAFRHQLIREAVLDEMLPGECAQAHRAFARALEARLEAGSRAGPEATLVVLAALHWRGAQDDEHALAAAWRAADAAGRALAYAQRLRMLEQVLDLWDRVPEPARPAWITSACSSSPPTPPAGPRAGTRPGPGGGGHRRARRRRRCRTDGLDAPPPRRAPAGVAAPRAAR
jgi:predicted ATPase